LVITAGRTGREVFGVGAAALGRALFGGNSVSAETPLHKPGQIDFWGFRHRLEMIGKIRP